MCFYLHFPNVNPECTCGESHEDAEHSLKIKCTRCDNREILKRKIEARFTCTLVLRYDAAYLTIKTNYLLFEAVHEYILETHRFDSLN